MTQEDAVVSDQENFGLQPPGCVRSVSVQGRYAKAQPLVEAEGSEIVVGGDKGQTADSFFPGFLFHQRQKGAADAVIFPKT